VSVTAKPITDVDLISKAIRHPRIWPSISDDGSPSPEEFVPIIDDSIIYLGFFDSDQFLGLFMLHPHNAACWEVHTCMLPIAWGRASLFAAECIEWVFNHTACLRLITNVPKDNSLARRLALSVGMREFGINPKSFLKNGIALDQYMLGISKE
jgi:RimJ/RimL family protein N-acetyltransferase